MAKPRQRRSNPRPAPPPRRERVRLFDHPGLRVLVVLGLGVLAYANTFHVPFVFDDDPNIVHNPAVHPGGHLALAGPRWFGLLTFAWNYAWGGLDVVGYHVVNLAIHLVAALVVYQLVRTILRAPAFAPAAGAAGAPAVSAWLCALLFVCHPIQTQAVTYTVQRLASLATLLYLLATLGYAHARLAESQPRRILSYLGALAAAILAMKTKEIAFTLPAAIALYEACFGRGTWRRFIAVAPFAVVALLVPLAFLTPGAAGTPASSGHIGQIGQAVQAGADAGISRGAYALTQVRVLVTYLRLLLLPAGQNLDYDYPISRSLAEPAVLASLLFLLAIIGAGVLAYRRSRRGGHPASLRLRLAAFGIFWFFLTLAVESSVVPLADVIFEHRLYLPSMGAFVVAASLAARSADSLAPARAWLGKAAVAVVIAALAVATHARNAVWQDEGGLWLDVLAKSPNKPRAHYNAATTFFLARGRLDEAVRHFETAIRLRPGYADAHGNLGIAFERQGRVDEATREYETAIALSADQIEAHNNLGGIYLKRGRAAEAVREIQTYVRAVPDAVSGYYNLGLAYESLAHTEDAIAAFTRVVALAPSDVDAHEKLAGLYLRQGQPSQAIPHLQAVITLRPDHQAAREALARLQTGGR